MADINAEDLTQETVSTLDGNEQFIMFDSVEGKRALLSLIADYIANHGEINGDTIPTLISAIESKIGTLTNLTTTDKTNLVSAINELVNNEGALSSLSTTVKTSLVAAINELVGDTSDLKEDLTDVQNELPNKANIDGIYEQMTVGNAEQLISSVTVNDKVPYNFRTSGGSIDIGNREVDKLVGGTVAWNQLFDKTKSVSKPASSSGTVSINNSTGVVTIAADGNSNGFQWFESSSIPIAGHKMLTIQKVTTDKAVSYATRTETTSSYVQLAANTPTTIAKIISVANYTGTAALGGIVADITETTNITVENIQVFDLTKMFGSTIADYINSLETATAGAGVAWFKKLFPKDYYAYNAGQLMSVKTSAHQMVGFNAWDEEWELGTISAQNGQTGTDNTRIRSKNYNPCVPNTTYYVKDPTNNNNVSFRFYDADKNYLGSGNGWIGNTTFVTPANCAYFKFVMGSAYGTTYKNDICINLHWDGERDGEYEAYKKWTYPLDSDLELRGIPKLDSANNLYYDGDTYESDGTVTRKYGVVDLGTLTWIKNTNAHKTYFQTTSEIADMKKSTGTTTKQNTFVCSKYLEESWSHALDDDNYDKYICVGWKDKSYVSIADTSYASSDASAFKTAMSGVYLVYELAEPTTEEAEPYQNPQIVDDFGTEEYVDERTVAIPVGHDTEYMNNLKAKLEMAPDSPDGDGDYVLRQTNGENSYVPLVKELPAPPTTNGTYKLTCTVSGGTPTYSWTAV